MKKTIFIGGDLFVGGDALGDDFSDRIRVADYHSASQRIVNLEHPLTDSGVPEKKCTLLAGSQAIRSLASAKITAVGLANNHIQDAGREGFFETMKILSEGGISLFGAGENISAASKPLWIAPDVALFGFCEHKKPYLNQVKAAHSNEWGVQPLEIANVGECLNSLPEGAQAILFIHWGREHVSFPPKTNLQLARRLLEDDRVIMIVGTHPHRVQGVLRHRGKLAFMSIGHFYFAPFFISPPTQIAYPEPRPKQFDVTYGYHNVTKLTLKKWRRKSRIGLGLLYDVGKRETRLIPLVQSRKTSLVSELNGLPKLLFFVRFRLLSLLYNLPGPIYRPTEKLAATGAAMKRQWYRLRQIWTQEGPIVLLRKISKRLRGKGPTANRSEEL